MGLGMRRGGGAASASDARWVRAWRAVPSHGRAHALGDARSQVFKRTVQRRASAWRSGSAAAQPGRAGAVSGLGHWPCTTHAPGSFSECLPNTPDPKTAIKPPPVPTLRAVRAAAGWRPALAPACRAPLGTALLKRPASPAADAALSKRRELAAAAAERRAGGGGGDEGSVRRPTAPPPADDGAVVVLDSSDSEGSAAPAGAPGRPAPRTDPLAGSAFCLTAVAGLGARWNR